MSVKIVYGGASISSMPNFKNDGSIAVLLETLKALGVDTIDTARLYMDSETLIGQQDLRTSFTIDTKIQGGFKAGSAKKDAVIAGVKDSLETLGIKQLDILYIHAPDKDTPIAETLEGVNEVYKTGAFRRFGISNFTAEQIQETYDIAKENGYVLPSVYQGNYSPVARHLETLIFPLLRKLGFSFYAYSPLAGGFLTKTPADLDAGVRRFEAGGIYAGMYDKPELREVLAEWNTIAEKEGVSKAELAYRWVASHSQLSADKGDAVLFGSSKLEQVKQTVASIRKGKLSNEAAQRVEAIWEKIKDIAPTDNFGAH